MQRAKNAELQVQLSGLKKERVELLQRVNTLKVGPEDGTYLLPVIVWLH